MNPIHDCFAKALPASAMILAAGLCIGTAFAQEPGKSITIDPNKTTITTSPLLYGIFFEEINRAGEGGIYAEMIQNRSFEDKSRVDEVRDTPLAWGATNAEAVLDRSQPLNKNNPTALKVKAQAGGFIVNGGFVRNFNGGTPGNIAVTGGDVYDLTFYARIEGKANLKAAFADACPMPESRSITVYPQVLQR